MLSSVSTAARHRSGAWMAALQTLSAASFCRQWSSTCSAVRHAGGSAAAALIAAWYAPGVSSPPARARSRAATPRAGTCRRARSAPSWGATGLRDGHRHRRGRERGAAHTRRAAGLTRGGGERGTVARQAAAQEGRRIAKQVRGRALALSARMISVPPHAVVGEIPTLEVASSSCRGHMAGVACARGCLRTIQRFLSMRKRSGEQKSRSIVVTARARVVCVWAPRCTERWTAASPLATRPASAASAASERGPAGELRLKRQISCAPTPHPSHSLPVLAPLAQVPQRTRRKPEDTYRTDMCSTSRSIPPPQPASSTYRFLGQACCVSCGRAPPARIPTEHRRAEVKGGGAAAACPPAARAQLWAAAAAAAAAGAAAASTVSRPQAGAQRGVDADRVEVGLDRPYSSRSAAKRSRSTRAGASHHWSSTAWSTSPRTRSGSDWRTCQRPRPSSPTTRSARSRRRWRPRARTRRGAARRARRCGPCRGCSAIQRQRLAARAHLRRLPQLGVPLVGMSR